MLRAIGFMIKVTVFAVLVLIAGNWFKWGGKTISDQVRTQLSHAERSDVAAQVKSWTKKMTDDARSGASKGPRSKAQPGVHTGAGNGSANSNSDRLSETATHPIEGVEVAQHEGGKAAGGTQATNAPQVDQVPSSERQKLKALIRELNSSSGK